VAAPRRVSAKRLADLKISPEVGWYLAARAIPLPDCPPRWKTPEPCGSARFDPARVDTVLAAFKVLRHTQGKWAGRPFVPDPWQVAYILAPVFGWVRRNDDGDLVRAIRTEYVELPRKNGKSTLAGAQAMYLTGADGESGAQVYAVAAAKDQARYCFDPVKALAERAPGLAPHVKVLQSRVVHKASASYFAVVASVADLMHGANVHGAVIDELHVHKTRDLVDAVETGTAARTQPLVVIITTADDSRQGTIYAEKRAYVEQLADGVIEDPTFYGVVWGADDADDPMAEATWRKANPGFGISPTREFLVAEAAKAKNAPATMARFKRLHLGIRTKQDTRYLDLAVWDRNAGLVDEAKLVGRRCVGGLDLAATTDLTALCWDFPDDDGGHDVIWRHWAPAGALAQLNRRTAGQADLWVKAGWLALTPGDVVDYGYIRAQIGRDMEKFSVGEVGYDPWNATQLVTDLQGDDAPMVTVRQGYATMSPPTKELLRLLLEGSAESPRYRHGGNPIVRWQVDHFAVEMDPAGNVKPSKAKASEKIDGLVAGIMALDRAVRHGGSRSIYEDEEMEVG
jgi:phage terminase large subunit-like protein